MDLVSKQTDEALGFAAESAKAVEDAPQVNTNLSFKDAATFVASATPIIGDAMAAKEVYDELNKDDPNYFLAGALGGAALVGLVPGLGDAAANAIRAGAKKAAETAKRVEVDPNALGSMGGNIRLKPKVNEDVVEAERLLDDPEALEQWRKENRLPESQRQKNPEGAKEAAGSLLEGDITSKEARKRIKEFIPDPQEFTAEQVREMMPTVTEITGALGKKAKKYPVLGVKGADLKQGQVVSSRLDIPAYDDYDTWVVSIHDGNQKSGSVVGYGQAIRLKNINFGSDPKTALDIARGKRLVQATGEDAPKPQGKATIARIFGEYQSADPYDLQRQAADIIESGSDEWIQVGMNPYRGSAFYDKKTGMPVFEADEVIQVGPLVLAKNVKKPTISQMKEMAVRTRDGKIRMFNEGGMAMDEQTQMAFALGGSVEEVDPVSGNEVPTGSLPEEVRDDIPAQLSEGEYVVPADVVRFYGVKFFEDLRTQAKQGFADMEANGRIGGEPIPPDGMEMVDPEDEDFPFDISELQTVAEDQPMVNMKDGGYLRGYNEGGFDAPAPTEIPDVSSVFESYFTGDNIEYKEYRDPATGAVATLRFVNGQPDSSAKLLIDQGYVTSESYNPTPEVTVEQPDTGESSSVNPSRESNSFRNEEEKVKSAQNTFKDYSETDLFELAERLGDPKVNKAITGLGAFAGPVGLIASIGKRATGFAVARELAERYKSATTDADRAKIQTLFDGVTSRGKEKGSGITGGGGLLGGGGILQDVDGSGTVDFGDTWLGDMLGFDLGGKTGIQGPSQSDSWDGARRTGGTGTKSNTNLGNHVGAVTKDDITKPTPKSEPKPKRRVSNNNDSGPSAAQIAQRNAQAASVAKNEGVSAPTSGGARSVKDTKSDTKGTGNRETYASRIARGGGFNKGGLMQKNKKKK